MTPRALKKWRLSLELTQAGFAGWLGVSRSTVNRWEGGLQAIPHMVALLESHYHRPDDREIPEPDDNSPTVTGVDTGGIIGEVHISSTEGPTTD